MNSLLLVFLSFVAGIIATGLTIVIYLYIIAYKAELERELQIDY